MAKGYGIIFVIIGHVDMPYLTTFFYAFHMPLFFFLSGYVFSIKSNLYSFLKAKFRRIIIPYFFLCIPVIFVNTIFLNEKTFEWSNFIYELEKFIIQERYTTLWFIACLFILNILNYIILVRCRYYWQSSIIVFIMSLCGIFLWRNGITALPWNFDAALVMSPFFYIGYLVKNKFRINDVISLSKISIFFILLLLCVVVGVFNAWNISISGTRIDVYYSHFYMEVISYFTAFVGIVLVILLSICYKCNIIRYIGENSLIYFAWHQTIILPFLSYFYWKTGLSQLYIYRDTVFFKWISVFLVLFLLSLLNIIIIKTKSLVSTKK